MVLVFFKEKTWVSSERDEMHKSIWKRAGKQLLLLIELSVINLDLMSEQRKPMKEFKERREHWEKRGRRDRPMKMLLQEVLH